jgi:ubiquinone/menaquinone biosynthesis C-methylase UbiE
MELRLEQNLKLSVIECYDRLAGMYSQRTRPGIRDNYLKPLLALPVGARIFDAGCGTGHDALVLCKAGCIVTGVDISPAMCAVARKNLSQCASAQVLEGDTESTEVGDAPFDAVLSALEIFHHEKPAETLSRYASLLKEGGILVLVTNHPIRNMLLHPAQDYFKESLVLEDWGDQGKVPKFHWMLSTYTSAINQAHLRISAIEEHPPSRDLATVQDASIRTKAVYPSLITFVCRK